MLPLGLFDGLLEIWDGVIGRVAERVGVARIWRRGRESCCSPSPFVMIRVRFGTLGRRGGAGRRKESCDGGEDPLEPFERSEDVVGMIGNGDGMG